MYHHRTAWRCAFYVGKKYGSKGYPQSNAAHVRRTLPVTSNSPLKQHLSGEHFPDDDAVERVVLAWFREQPQELYGAGFQGFVKWWDKSLNLFGDYIENKCCLYVIIPIRLFSITICNLLIDFPHIIKYCITSTYIFPLPFSPFYPFHLSSSVPFDRPVSGSLNLAD